MLWKVIRRVLALGIHIAFGRPMFSFIALAVIVGVAGFAALGSMDRSLALAAPPAPAAASGAPAAPRSASVPSGAQNITSPAVDDYLKGMTTFNAQLMWRALSQQAIDDMTSQGGSLQALQARLDQAKQNGARYEGITFIGGYPLQNGELFLFYVVSRRGFAGPNQFDQVYFVFTVGQDGKIIQIQ